MDDDIVYPFDYVSRLSSALADFGKFRLVVAHHGGTLPPQVRTFAQQRNRGGHRFVNRLDKDRYANVPGTGVTAFYDSGLPRPESFQEFYVLQGEGDLSLAIWCQKHQIPIILIRQPGNRFQIIPNRMNLWKTMLDNEKRFPRVTDNATRVAQSLTWQVHEMPMSRNCSQCNVYRGNTSTTVDVGCFRKCYDS